MSWLHSHGKVTESNLMEYLAWLLCAFLFSIHIFFIRRLIDFIAIIWLCKLINWERCLIGTSYSDFTLFWDQVLSSLLLAEALIWRCFCRCYLKREFIWSKRLHLSGIFSKLSIYPMLTLINVVAFSEYHVIIKAFLWNIYSCWFGKANILHIEYDIYQDYMKI